MPVGRMRRESRVLPVGRETAQRLFDGRLWSCKEMAEDFMKDGSRLGEEVKEHSPEFIFPRSPIRRRRLPI